MSFAEFGRSILEALPQGGAGGSLVRLGNAMTGARYKKGKARLGGIPPR